jgi:hypothetical protein
VSGIAIGGRPDAAGFPTAVVGCPGCGQVLRTGPIANPLPAVFGLPGVPRPRIGGCPACGVRFAVERDLGGFDPTQPTLLADPDAPCAVWVLARGDDKLAATRAVAGVLGVPFADAHARLRAVPFEALAYAGPDEAEDACRELQAAGCVVERRPKGRPAAPDPMILPVPDAWRSAPWVEACEDGDTAIAWATGRPGGRLAQAAAHPCFDVWRWQSRGRASRVAFGLAVVAPDPAEDWRQLVVPNRALSTLAAFAGHVPEPGMRDLGAFAVLLGGDAALVGDGRGLQVSVPALRWAGPHALVDAHEARLSLPWPALDADPVGSEQAVLDALVAVAIERRARFTTCDHCRESKPPEWMATGGRCYACRERYDRVAH